MAPVFVLYTAPRLNGGLAQNCRFNKNLTDMLGDFITI
jgi:hypothetical protein